MDKFVYCLSFCLLFINCFMKTLCLLRHAKSSWKDPSLADIDRPLSARGKREAVMIGNILKQQDFCPDIIMCSSSKRTRSTLKRVRRFTKRKKKSIIYTDRLYEISLQSFLYLIHELDDRLDTVVMVGHNPGCSELAQFL